MSVRRLRNLVTAIPPESSFGLAMGAYRPGWSNAEELLAIIAELVDQNTRMFVIANSKKGTQAPKPIDIQRPTRVTDAEAKEPKRRQATPAELRAWFGGAVRVSKRGVGRSRCARGHFVKPGTACAQCVDTAVTDQT